MKQGMVSDAIRLEWETETNVFIHHTRHATLQLLKFLYNFNIKGTLNGVNR